MAINLNVTRADSSEYDAQLLLGIKGDPGKSAYEYAVDAGYTGTETDFTLLMESLEEFQDVTATAETLDAGESATASFSDGELSLGIPKGYSAGFGTVSATVDANHGVPAVTVTASGEDTAKNFAFAFSNLQPAPYDDSVIQARMDSFTNLEEGSTTGDAELIDGRVGADGVTYTNIGDAIRGQVTDLKSEISVGELPLDKSDSANVYTRAVVGNQVSFASSASSVTYKKIIPVQKGRCYTLKITESATPASIGHRDSAIADSSGIVRQIIGTENTAGETYTTEFMAVVDGYLYLTVDKNYADIAIQGDSIYYDSVVRIGEIERGLVKGISLDSSMFEKGGLVNGENDTYRAGCRVRMKSRMSFPFDVKATSKTSNAGVTIFFFENDTYSTSETYYNSTYTIPANSVFRLFIDARRGQTLETLTIDECLANFETFNSNIEENATNIEKLLTSANVVPDYYFENDYLDDRCVDAQKRTGNGMISFGFITDVHTGDSACNSMLLADYISKKTSAMPFMVFGGDVPETNTGNEAGFYAQAMKWQEMMAQYGKDRVYSCRGNHDYLTTASGVDPMSYGECRSLVVGNLYTDVVFSAPDSMSYYFDVDGTNTRIIVLDCYSVSHNRSNPFSGYVGISPSTYYWFVDYALKADGMDIIVVAHEPINTPTAVSNLALLKNVISAFSKHESFSGSYGATTINVDFSTYTSNLVCVMSGHTHVDAIGCSGRFVSIVTKADAMYGTGRTIGTINEGAFDIVSIDYTDRIAYCTRIGSGADRIIHLTVVTSTSDTLVTSLTGTVTWASSDESVATVSNGTITAVGSGDCYITATDENGTVEMWGINI